jgi:uncharacterized repeat protein (TIGR03843 family)
MAISDQISKALKTEALHLLQPLDDASNATFLASVGDFEVVYKPVSGEAPLWDFPMHTLSKREVSAYWVSECFGWNLVPPTVWTEKGPLGPGSVQLFIPDATVSDVAIFDVDAVPESWIAILQGQMGEKEVLVAHADNAEVQKLAVFDAIINNGDRKAGHILRDSQGALHAIDHGVSFHVTNKLRTVLWGWAEEPLNSDLVESLKRGLQVVRERQPQWLLNSSEYDQLLLRIEKLLVEGMPLPSDQWPAVPWPIF